MSFPRHPGIYPSDGGASLRADASTHRLDDLPAGYSLAGCSPALPASASPTRHHFALKSNCRSSNFQRSAPSVLTVCLSPGGQSNFTKCALLMQDLLAAKRDLRLSREIKRLARYDGLIIDDLGYLQQSRDDMEVVFTLLAERYERGSVPMTSNLPFSKWEAIFKDAMMTAAAIDRLVHHSVIIELNIPSHRVEHAKKQQQEETQGEGD